MILFLFVPLLGLVYFLLKVQISGEHSPKSIFLVIPYFIFDSLFALISYEMHKFEGGTLGGSLFGIFLRTTSFYLMTRLNLIIANPLLWTVCFVVVLFLVNFALSILAGLFGGESF